MLRIKCDGYPVVIECDTPEELTQTIDKLADSTINNLFAAVRLVGDGKKAPMLVEDEAPAVMPAAAALPVSVPSLSSMTAEERLQKFLKKVSSTRVKDMLIMLSQAGPAWVDRGDIAKRLESKTDAGLTIGALRRACIDFEVHVVDYMYAKEGNGDLSEIADLATSPNRFPQTARFRLVDDKMRSLIQNTNWDSL